MPLFSRAFPRALLRLVVIACLTYLGMCGFMAWKKNEMIFPWRGQERAAGKIAPPSFETWWHTMRDGARVEAWWRPARDVSPATPAPAVLVFHGNGELIDDSVDFANAWRALGASVLLVEYRGYGRSEGTPSINACRDDAVEWFDLVAAHPVVRGDLVLAHGVSLGGVFATELAALRPVAGLALEGTVASLRQAARDRSIWVLLTHERFDAETILRELDPTVPVLITHGRKDDIVPFHHFERLAAARPGAVAVAGDGSHIPLATWDRSDLLRDLLAAARARAARADNALASPPAVSAP